MQHKIKKKRMKSIIYGLISFLLTCCILFMPDAALNGASNGLLLWFNQVLPAMLPCMILTAFFLHTGLPEKLTNHSPGLLKCLTGLSPNGLYTAVLGLLCGYPMGAKITADLYRRRLLSKKEAAYLLSFANQLSPSFLIEYVLYGLFSDSGRHMHMLLCIYSGLALTALLYRVTMPVFQPSKETFSPGKSPEIQGKIPNTKTETSKAFTLGESLDVSVMNSLEIIARIGGYMILFSVLAEILCQAAVFPKPWDAILVSIIELTTGLFTLHQTFGSSPLGLSLVCALCAFGGLSSVMQTVSVCKDTDLSMRGYLRAKLLQSALTFLLAGLFFGIR